MAAATLPLPDKAEVLVIGAGPGGYVAAIRAAQLGKSVVVIDKAEIGGVCLNQGCIPSKSLISAAHRYENMKDAGNIGIRAGHVELDFPRIQEWKNGIVGKLTGGIAALLAKHNIRFIQGEAAFANEQTVLVTMANEIKSIPFSHCIIAAGSRPVALKSFPFGQRILSSTEALNLPEIPQSLIVIGGGYIGIELGQTYAKLGTKVTVLEGSDAILPGFEKELSRLVDRRLRKSGVEVFTNAIAQEAVQRDDGLTVHFTVRGERKQVSADYVLVTVGRSPNTDGLGLQAIGIATTERGLIEIDSMCRTSVPNIYAIGDIVPGPALAHKAAYEAKVAAEAIAGQRAAIDYKAIPSVVFSDPEIASVGLNESQAKEAGYAVAIGKFPYAANGRALSMSAAEGFVKLVADEKSGQILGAQVVGSEASNLIAEIGLAIEMGATSMDIALTIHAHPTLGEMTMEAAESALGRATHI
jgi:dihydrolipoamide dehydrogenase